MEPIYTDQFKNLKPIDEKDFKEMHKAYKDDKGGKGKGADKVEKDTAWVRLHPEDLVEILKVDKLQSVKFILVADPKKHPPHSTKYLPTIVIQLKVEDTTTFSGFNYLYYTPSAEADTCPLPYPCDKYEDSI